MGRPFVLSLLDIILSLLCITIIIIFFSCYFISLSNKSGKIKIKSESI